MNGIDLRDVLFWFGFVCLWSGLWMAYSPAAPIVCGMLLIGVSLYSVTRKAE